MKAGKYVIRFVLLLLIVFNNRDLYSEFSMPISSDLDTYSIRVGYGFAGHELTLFGTKERLNKIAIHISGPERDFLTTKREKFHGLWIKKKVAKLFDIQSFEQQWISSDMKKNTEILDFNNLLSGSLLKRKIEDYDHFVDYMQSKNLYHNIEQITVSNNNLFKIIIPLPKNATIGKYLVNVLSFNNNVLVDGKTTMSFDLTHSEFNKFLYTMNKDYHEIYLIIILTISAINVFIARYFFVKK